MPYLSKQELLDLKNTNPGSSVYHSDTSGYNQTRIAAERIDEATADVILAHDLARTLRRRQMSKSNRPWELINISAKLDPNEPWMGFEYEMGLKSVEHYEAVINHVWHNYNNVAFDLEGYGEYCPEITYPPQELSKYMKGESYIQKTLAFLAESKIRMPNFDGHYVGTHLNLSTPSFRKLLRGQQQAVCSVINNSLLMLTRDEMTTLFGRKLYGVGGLMAGWIEFKMFKSTDDLVVFNRYVEVGRHMAELMEHLSRKTLTLTEYKDGRGTTFIRNLYDILDGKTPAENVEFHYTKMVTVAGAPGWRYYGNTYENYRNTGEKYACAA